MKTLLWGRRRLQKSFVAIHGICCIMMETPMIRIYQKRKTVQRLCAPQYKDRPYPWREYDLGENMTLVNQVIGQYWKPRYLLDNEAKCAYEFMSIDEVLQIVTDEDIDWDSLKGLPQDAFERAKAHSFHFPGHVYQYKMAWQKWNGSLTLMVCTIVMKMDSA